MRRLLHLAYFEAVGRLLFGLCCVGLGLTILATPLVLTGLEASLWGVFFWAGGTLVVFGGLLIDLVLLAILFRRVRPVWERLLT